MHHSNSISMLFTMPNYQPFDESDIYSSYASPNSSVDCTLSLGTPSTRLTNDTSTEKRSHRRSGFCWNILKPKQTPSPPPPATNKAGRGSSNVSGGGGGDPLLARRCANCDTTSTPLWRNGPRGPKSLCNACGIRFKKEERRASAAAATTPTGGAPAGVMEHQYILNNSWAQHSHSQIYPSCYSPAAGNEFTFMENNSHGDMGDTGIPFLSWGLNVTDRSSFVHY